ncbi:MAG: nitrilase-related carbon-nitrogen hydrolase [Acidobacteriota bacterium]
MASSRNPLALGEALLAIAISSVLFYFGLGLHPIWPLVWLAPLPLLVFALRGSWLAAGLASIAAMMLGGVNMWGYLVTALGSPASVWFTVFLFAGVFFAAGVLLFRALVLRGALWSGLVALPAAYTACEFLRNSITPHGSAGSLAYSQLNFVPFLQLASITGPWGMTFVLLLFPSALAIAWHSRASEPQRGWRVLGGMLALVAAVLVFGFVRLAVPTGDTVRVGLIAHDQPDSKPVADSGAATEQLFTAYADAAQRLAAEGAQAIVIPEKIAVTLDGKSGGSDAILQSLANETGATVVAGVVDVDGPVKYNQARIYTPDAAMETYDKEHMLPPFESNLKPGTSLAVLHRAQQTWGVAICKDMDFGSPARRYGKVGAGLLLVPAWDFVMDGFYHGHIAVMRGVEDGFSVARTAKNGLLYASDSRGRILGETSSTSAPFATLLVNVPVAHSWTVYQAWGDWFAWVAIALLMFGVVQLLRQRV